MSYPGITAIAYTTAMGRDLAPPPHVVEEQKSRVYRKYIYIVLKKGVQVCKGTNQECAAYIGCPPEYISHAYRGKVTIGGCMTIDREEANLETTGKRTDRGNVPEAQLPLFC